VTKSTVPDPAVWDNLKRPPQTAWRVDRMKNMTYTQFWQLVKERRVDKVRCCTSLCFPSISIDLTCFDLPLWALALFCHVVK
jgi:hypothetical protein